MRRKTWTLLTAIALATVPITGCEDESSVEEAADDVGDAIEDAADEVGDAVEDAADEVGDAVEDVADEVDDTIDEIDPAD